MYEVSPRAWLYFLELFARAGVNQDDIVAVIPELASTAEGSLQRIEWDVFCRVCDEVASRVPADRLRVAARGLPRAAASRPLAAIAQLVGSPQALYRAMFTWFAPSLLAVPRFAFEAQGRHHCRATMTIDPPRRSSAALFIITAGMLEGLPALMGLPDAQVDVELVPGRATYLIASPARDRPLRAGLARVRQVVRGLRGAADELVAQEQSLRESLERLERLEQVFRRIIDGLPDAVLVHRDGVIVYANPALRAALLLGERDQLLGRHLRELVLPDADHLPPPQPEVIHPGSRVTMRTQGGGQVLFEVLSVQGVDFGGPATILVARDVTQRRALEVRLAVADRMLSMGTLAAGVAHEINNPLSYVIANLRTLGRSIDRLELPDLERSAIADMLGDAQEGTERVRGIVADLGTFARPDDGTIGTIDVGTVVERTMKLADNQLRHRARLIRKLNPVPPVRGNEAHLGQVLLNLLINAAQASSESSSDRAVTIEVGLVQDRVAIAVSDTGPAIPEADRARIFDPYFTLRPMGMGGLGLSICHSLVTGMGGTIEVASRVGVGTTFTVVLPLAPPPRITPPSNPPPLTAGTRLRILVIDDELRVARALARALEGFDVTVEDNGARALGRLLGDEHFDLVFCDLMMPTLSGMALHARLARERPGYEQRLVFMTGGAFTPEASEFLKRVDNPCLAKPFGLEQVLALVRGK